MVVSPSSCQRERADHCSTRQPACVGPWGCTQGRASVKMDVAPSQACWGSLWVS